jgi:hypothetical protein
VRRAAQARAPAGGYQATQPGPLRLKPCTSPSWIAKTTEQPRGGEAPPKPIPSPVPTPTPLLRPKLPKPKPMLG